MRSRRLRIWTWAVVGVSLLLAFASFGPWGAVWTASAAAESIYIAVAMLATAVAFVRARQTRGAQRIVYLFAARAMVFAVAARIVMIHFPWLLDPERSGAFTAWAIMIVYSLGAIAVFWATAERKSFTYALDGLLISTSLLFLTWHALLARILSNFEGNFAATTIAISSPVWDMVMFTMAVLAARRGTHILSRQALLLFAAATAFDTVGDTWWAYNGMATPLDSLTMYSWTVYCLLLAICLLAPEPTERGQVKSASLGFVMFPYVPPLLAGGAAVYLVVQRIEVTQASWILGAAVASCLVLRQFMAMIENIRISKTLEQTVFQLRARELELEHLALHDPLTSLPNRRFLSKRVLDTEDASSQFVVLLIDVDDFKQVNDTLGHETGDALLMYIAACLQAAVRTDDTVARLGGDEFAILLEQTTVTKAKEIAERISESVSDAITISGVPVQVGLSIGLAAGSGLGTFDQVLRHADQAMYARKRSAARGGLAIFAT